MNKNNIIILGCGLSGMITALSLAKHKIPGTIIEASATDQGSFFNDIRTTALTSHSKEFLQKIGLWSEISPLCGAINDIYVANNRKPQMLHFSKKDTPDNKIMGYLVENSAFKKCLHDLLKKNELITVLDNVKYQKITNEPNGCHLTLMDNSELACNLLIVCDSRNSPAKNLFFSNKIEQDYKQKAITCIVEHELSHEGTAVEHFLSTGPFAILPLKDVNKSSIVWTVPQDYASALLSLPMDEFISIVQKNFGSFLGKITINGNRAVFPLKAHAVKRYYNKNIVLVADTAHTIHPLAGQGLNQGIKDIECLTRLIAKFGANAASLSDYQKERQADNEHMLIITDSINSIFASKSKLIHSTVEIGFKFIEKFPVLKKILVGYAMGKR